MSVSVIEVIITCLTMIHAGNVHWIMANEIAFKCYLYKCVADTNRIKITFLFKISFHCITFRFDVRCTLLSQGEMSYNLSSLYLFFC
jgi:hypothetical protein